MKLKPKKSHISIFLTLIFLTIISITVAYSMYTSEQNDKKIDTKTDRYIIKLKDGEKFESFASNVSKKINTIRPLKNKENKEIILITLQDKADKISFINGIKSGQANKYIEYIVPDDQLIIASNDPLFDQQWPIYTTQTSNYSVPTTYSEEIGVVPSWDISTGENTIIALLDTGVDYYHSDLQNNIWKNTNEIDGNLIDDDGNGYVDDIYGYNFYDNNNISYDPELSYDEWHSTHLAGIIAAQKDNDLGITGSAPDAKIMPLKIFSNGTAYTSAIIEAITYADTNGANIANCSFGTTQYNEALKEAIENSNMLFVCAAGNGKNEMTETGYKVYPAAYELSNIISVAATNRNGNLSSFSNYGDTIIDVAAPGDDILSTFPNNSHKTSNGTSMSAAFVSGQAALIYSQNPTMTPQQIKQRICDTTVKLSSLTDKVKTGGIINVWNGMNNIIDNNIIQVIEEEEESESTPMPQDPGYSLYSTKTWSVLSPITQGLNGHATTVMNNYIYVAGGYNSGTKSTLYRFNGTSWSTMTSMSQPRYKHTLSAVSTNIYAIGGSDASGNALNYNEQYNGSTWSTKDNIPTARYAHSAVEYKGKIYVFGGRNTGGTILTSVQVFDPAQSSGYQWSTKANMPVGRRDFAIAAVGSKIYCIGGNTNPTGNSATVDIYNPDSDTWDTVRPASMPSSLTYMAATTYNNTIYVAGGITGSATNAMIQYDPAMNTWITKNSMQYPRLEHTVTTYNGGIHVIGGHNFGSSLNYVEKYTETPTLTNTWSSMTSLSGSTAVTNHGSTTLPGLVMIAGGRNSNNQILKSARVANIAKTTWSLLPDMNNAREKLTLSTCDGYVYAIGGINGSNVSSVVEKYDPTAKTWTTLSTSIPTPSYGHRAVVVNSKIYIIGGYNSSGTIIGTVQIYNPSNNTWDTGKPSMGTARADFGIGVVNNNIYVFGGNTAGGGTTTVEEFNASTNIWSNKTSLLGATQKYTIATVSNNKIYIAGGRNSANSLLNTVYEYIPAVDGWTQLNNMPAAKTDFSFNEVNGEMIAIGGNTGSITNDVRKFRATNFAPNSPTSMIYTDTDTNIVISWAAPADAVSYEVEIDGNIYSTGSTSYNFAYSGTIPVHSYRVRGVNECGKGLWNSVLVLSEMKKATINCTPGEAFNVMITASDIDKFTGKVFTVKFDATKFDIVDLNASTQANDIYTSQQLPWQIPNSNIYITSYSTIGNNIVIKFNSTQTVETNKTWSGVVNIIRLKPKAGISNTNYIYSSTLN